MSYFIPWFSFKIYCKQIYFEHHLLLTDSAPKHSLDTVRLSSLFLLLTVTDLTFPSLHGCARTILVRSQTRRGRDSSTMTSMSQLPCPVSRYANSSGQSVWEDTHVFLHHRSDSPTLVTDALIAFAIIAFASIHPTRLSSLGDGIGPNDQKRKCW